MRSQRKFACWFINCGLACIAPIAVERGCMSAMASPLLCLYPRKCQHDTHKHPERPDLALLFDAVKEGVCRDPSFIVCERLPKEHTDGRNISS